MLAGCGRPGASAPTATVVATRTANTPRGPVTIPANPQRLVAIYSHDLANALALGLAVIAGPGENGQPGAPFPPYLVEAFGSRLDSVTRIAYRPELNFEQIASLQPDVILSGIFGPYDPGYEKLDAIASTVTYHYSEGDQYVLVPWQTVLRINGEQFGREAAAEEWISRFEQRAADLRTRLALRWAGTTFAVVEPLSDSVFLYGATSGHMPITLSEKLGLKLADSVSRLLAEAGIQEQGGTRLSLERLGEIDADVLFVLISAGATGTPDRSGFEVMTAQALWATLPAVQSGHVYEITGDIFYESGPMAMAFLDVVERALLP
ncbi:MAG: hypothetical protein OHK0015_06120 [Chloroflexi bacterium OHK40]